MTTSNKIFTKLFDENEKAKWLYKDYNFSEYSQNKKNFLQKLSVITKYKQYFVYFLTKRKISDRDKVNYIQVYKASMTYPEYIKYNMVTEKHEKNFVNVLYIIGGVNLFFFFYFMIKKPTDYSIGREMCYSFLFSLLCGVGYRKYDKLSYSASLTELYSNLEDRLNKHPEMKNEEGNINFVTDENYDEDIEDQM
jgi:hypothetical protein